MKLITKKLWVFVAMLCTLISASAYDFEVDGIYYDISSEADKEVSVTHGTYYQSASYFGVVNIPASVIYNGETYSVTSIGEFAFNNCENLQSVTIPNSVTSIGRNAFNDCSKLQSITIPNSVTYIGSNAFVECTNLRSLTIGSGVKNIDADAFSYYNDGKYKYYTYTIPKVIWLGNTRPNGYDEVSARVNYVSNNEFGLSNQEVYPFLSSRFEVGNVVYVPVSPSERTCDVIDCNYNPSSTEIVIDSIVNNRNIQLKVLDVNPYSFYGNDKITSLKISNSGNIGEKAFYECKSLKTADLSNKGYLGSSAFYNCSSLETATLNINGDIGESCFGNCAKLSLVKIGAQVTEIGSSAFAANTSLPEIIIPDNITSLGKSTFSGCSSLANVTIGKGINTLPISLFSGCKSLASIVIPNNINSIGNNVFYGCSNLGDVTIEEGESTLNLGRNGSSPLFSDCKLDEVFIGRKLSYSTSSSSGYSPFYRNTSLRSVTITNAETQIYDNEFYGCSNLQEFACGNGITSIGQRAFSGCSALKTYSSGSKVESIGAEAFSDCTALTSFTSYATVPPTCGTQALDDINKWDCVLHVPSESIDDYQAAAQWKEFFYIDEASGIEDIAVDNSQATVKIERDGFYVEGTAPVHVSVFSIDGKTCLSSVVAPHQTITLPTGLYIVKLGNKTMKIKI